MYKLIFCLPTYNIYEAIRYKKPPKAEILGKGRISPALMVPRPFLKLPKFLDRELIFCPNWGYFGGLPCILCLAVAYPQNSPYDKVRFKFLILVGVGFLLALRGSFLHFISHRGRV